MRGGEEDNRPTPSKADFAVLAEGCFRLSYMCPSRSACHPHSS